jgi:hypothetical protein
LITVWSGSKPLRESFMPAKSSIVSTTSPSRLPRPGYRFAVTRWRSGADSNPRSHENFRLAQKCRRLAHFSSVTNYRSIQRRRLSTSVGGGGACQCGAESSGEDWLPAARMGQATTPTWPGITQRAQTCTRATEDFNSLHAQREACEAFIKSLPPRSSVWSCSRTACVFPLGWRSRLPTVMTARMQVERS